MIDPAVVEEREREEVVGRGDDVRRRDREAVHLGDDPRQDRIDHPAQLDRQPRPQLLQTIGLGEDLVVGGHPRREVRLQHGAGQAGRVARHELAAVETGGHDVDHAIGAAEHPEHVHHLGQATDLFPREHLDHLGPEQVGAGELETRLRRHTRRRLHDEPNRQPATRLDGIAHAGHARDVRELVRIDEHRRRTARADGFRVRAGRQHRRLEMHVHVDEPGSEEATFAVDHVERVGARAALVDARDDRPDDADVGNALLAATDVDHRSASEEQVERLASLGGRNRAGPNLRLDSVNAHDLLRSPSSGRTIDQLRQDPAELDRHPVCLHVHLGRQLEG